MTRIIEVKATELIQRHLDRDPRVLEYRDAAGWNGEVLTAIYNPHVPCSAIIKAQAAALGLDLR